MIGEYRALQADVDSRRHFTPEKQPIMDTRSMIDEWLTPADEPYIDPQQRSVQSASALRQAEETGFIEVG